LLYEVDYKYDVFGNRVEADVDPEGDGDTDAITRYALDGWQSGRTPAGGTDNAAWNVWAELDGQNSNALSTRYLRGDVVDQIFAREDGSGNAYWTLTDRLGSVRDVADNTGLVKDTLSYDAYGNIISETASASRGNYAWTGREFDGTTGLQYNRARFYDPKTGRWQSQDPFGFEAGDSNLYRYVRNDVADSTDASGFAACQVVVPQLILDQSIINKPLVSTHGSFIWPVSFRLNNKTATGGWIIQKLTIAYKIVKGEADVTAKVLGKTSESYWEAWEVKKDQTVPTQRLGNSEDARNYWAGNVRGLYARLGAARKLSREIGVDFHAGIWSRFPV
jgi:RHS repeat-associated protein